MNGSRLTVRDVLLMLAGATLTTIGFKYIYDPSGLVTGGVTGLSIVVRHISKRLVGFEVPLWAGNLIFNIPIFIVAIRADGIRSVLRSGFVWLVMTLELAFLPELRFMPDNLLLVAIYGSLLVGGGTGLLLYAEATSAGTDMLGKALFSLSQRGGETGKSGRNRSGLPAFSIGRFIEILDGIVVLFGLIVFGIERTLYAMISVYISGKVIDYVTSLGKTAKMAMIISDHTDEIAEDIMTKLERGATKVTARGMYTGEEKNVLFCICTGRDLIGIKNIVRRYDPNAFFVVNNVNEAMGEGFGPLLDFTS